LLDAAVSVAKCSVTEVAELGGGFTGETSQQLIGFTWQTWFVAAAASLLCADEISMKKTIKLK